MIPLRYVTSKYVLRVPTLGLRARGRSVMPRGLQRIYGHGHLHFITFSWYRRLPLLRSARARGIFVKVLGQVRKEYGFKLMGYVVLPEHVHLLISEPERGTPSTVLKMLKQRESRLLRRKARRRFSAAQRTFQFASSTDSRPPRFWQKRFAPEKCCLTTPSFLSRGTRHSRIKSHVRATRREWT